MENERRHRPGMPSQENPEKKVENGAKKGSREAGVRFSIGEEGRGRVYLNDTEIELQPGQELYLGVYNTPEKGFVFSANLDRGEGIKGTDEEEERPAVYRHNPSGVVFNLEKWQINLPNDDIKALTRNEAEIIEMMTESPENTLEVKDYAERCFSEDPESEENIERARNKLKVHIRKIRKKLEDGNVEKEVIKTSRGKGYSMSGKSKDFVQLEKDN